MAQPIKTKGIVIRQVNYGEYDKMLTVLSDSLGKISVSARGVRGIKNKNRAACELLCYSELVLTPPRGEVYSLSQAECLESFYHLREDCVKLALGIYMADIAGHLAPEDMQPALKLLLNTLYILAQPESEAPYIKLLFDLKLLLSAGFAPETEECVSCQGTEAPFSFSALSGGVLCGSCAKRAGLSPSDGNALRLMDYILKSPLSKKLYMLKADAETVNNALKMTESFVAVHVRDELKSLEYYKKLVKML